MTSVEQLSALYCSLKVACNSNSKKVKKRHDIALQDVPLCLKLHVILILRKTTKSIASNSNSEKAIAAFFNTVVHEGKMSVYIAWPYLHSLLFRSKRHGYTLRRETSPNLSKSIFPPNY